MLPVLLVVGLVARGHTLQALGLALACEHPMLPSSADAAEEHHDEAPDGSHHDCPPSCHDCACGRIPMMLPLAEVPPHLLLEAYEIAASTPPEMPGFALACRLERPPRRPRA